MLLIHTALHAEANTLIESYTLKRTHQYPAFPCFTSDDIWLVESGMSKLNAANAVGWLSALWTSKHPHQSPPIWLNIGLAGHAEADVSNCLRIQRIEDSATGERHYPLDIANHEFNGTNLITVDEPVTQYPEQSAVDMEASGFVSAAKRFTYLELIQSIKIVSDNPQHPPQKFKPAQINEWIHPHLTAIDGYIQQLVKLRSDLDDAITPDMDSLLTHWHFSQYQSNQLQRLLKRYSVFNPDICIADTLPESLTNANDVLNWLEQQIQSSPINYSA